MARVAMSGIGNAFRAASGGRLRVLKSFYLPSQPQMVTAGGSSRIWPGGGHASLTSGSSASSLLDETDSDSVSTATQLRNSHCRNGADRGKVRSVTGSGESLQCVMKLCQLGRLEEAIDAACDAVKRRLPVCTNSTVYYRLLQMCMTQNDLTAGRRVHALMDQVGIATNIFLGSLLLRMYAAGGSLMEAKQVFDNLPAQNSFAWTTMISAYSKHGQGEQAIELYDQFRESVTRPDEYLFVAAVKACASTGALLKGKLIHSHVVEEGYDSSIFVSNSLIDMYCKCGSLQDARKVLDEMVASDVVSWNTLIRGYLQQGLSQEAFELFEQMQARGLEPDQFTFVSILKACSNTGSLVPGMLIHSYAMERGYHTNLFVGSTLIDMYAKFGNLEEAQKVFDSLPFKDVVSWNALIAGYIQHGLGQEALALFSVMHQQGKHPDRVSYLRGLKACSSIGALDQGKLMHLGIVRAGLESDVFIGSTVVDMFVSCGELKAARAVFDRISVKDVVAWTTMIAGYAQQGHGQEAIQLYQQMQQEGLQPNEFTLVSILKACSMIGALEQGKVIHANSVAGGFDSNKIFCSTLIDMYSRCGSVADARKVFDRFQSHDLLSWNAMVAGYAQYGSATDAILLFRKMQEESAEPDRVTFISILKACSVDAALEQGMLVHSYIGTCDMGSDVHLGSALIDMYVGCANLVEARNVFDKLPTRDLMSWTALIAGFAQQGDGKEALELYHRMQVEGVAPTKVTFLSVIKVCSCTADLAQGRFIHNHVHNCGFGSDLYVGSSLIDMYCKCGSLEEAHRVFERLPAKNMVSWTALITGYVQKGEAQEALHLFQRMQMDGVHSDIVTLASILKACSSAASLHLGQLVHAEIKQRGLDSDVVIRSALIDMYGKCGSPKDARKVFEGSSTRDLVAWNAMIAAYANHGLLDEALRLLGLMQSDGVRPNNVTFVCLISACSHTGLVDMGRQLFRSMSEDFSISPSKEHYACMVNLLGRAGQLAEAEDLISRMPSEPDIVVWMSLLGACKIHGNAELGRRAFQTIVNSDPKSSGAYVLMSNIYAAAGRVDDCHEIRQMMEIAGAKKVPGRTWMELDTGVHTFQVSDKDHPERKDIFDVLETVEAAMDLQENSNYMT